MNEAQYHAKIGCEVPFEICAPASSRVICIHAAWQARQA
jgi:hypothetical protein